jgi:hypothetical protein
MTVSSLYRESNDEHVSAKLLPRDLEVELVTYTVNDEHAAPRNRVGSYYSIVWTGRGWAAVCPRPLAESPPDCGAEVPAVLDGAGGVDGWGAAGRVDARAQPVSTIAVRITNLFIVSILRGGENRMRSCVTGGTTDYLRRP